MTLPQTQRWDSIPNGGVATHDNTAYFLKSSNTTSVDLSSGAINNAVDPGSMLLYLPSAALVLG